jgi:hypothetical protein
MRRVLLVLSLTLPLGCGAAAKSPVVEEKSTEAAVVKTEKTVARTGDPRDASASRTASESVSEAAPPVAVAKPAEGAAEPEPAAKAAKPKPPKEFAQLEPPDAPATESPPSLKPAPKGTELVLPHIRLTAPGNWVAKKPDVQFLLAEFTLPRAAGDDADGRVTITTAGGGVKQVMEMWQQQFGGKPDKEAQEEPQVLGMWVRLLDMSGTYRPPSGSSAPVKTHPNYRLLGAICDVGDQNQMYFIKAVGPAKTIAAHEKEFRAFVASMKLKQ